MGDDETEESISKNNKEKILHQWSLEGFSEILNKELELAKTEMNHYAEKVNRIYQIIEKLGV